MEEFHKPTLDSAVNRIRVFGGYFGLTEQQTEALADEVAAIATHNRNLPPT